MKPMANDIMSKKLVTILHSASLLEAYHFMHERKIRHLPVIDEAGVPIGIISDRDLQRAMRSEQQSFAEGTIEFPPNAKVRDYMAFPVKTVAPAIPIVDVATMMLTEKISAYLVTGADGRPRGIVTTDDMLKYLISIIGKDPARKKLQIDSFMDAGEASAPTV